MQERNQVRRNSVLIIGFGDIGQRVVQHVRQRVASRRIEASEPPTVSALIRQPARADALRAMHVTPRVGDLADAASLAAALSALHFCPQTVMHFAPPPQVGALDTHTRNLIAALSPQPPERLVYISTTGVYGNCNGAWVDEASVLNPTTARAARRVDAESVLQDWCSAHQVVLTILRAPGIYAEGRLPIARLQAGTPALLASEDSYTNHIHADDLASACLFATKQTQSDTFNVVDDSDIKMGDYFDLVADHFGLPRPVRVSRQEAAARIAEPMLSFMRESRRIRNDKVKRVLGAHGWQLRYPTVADFLRALPRG
jgi:nucleoside-diphosphate-sugar epimerase